MPPAAGKFALTSHVTVSLGWMGGRRLLPGAEPLH